MNSQERLFIAIVIGFLLILNFFLLFIRGNGKKRR